MPILLLSLATVVRAGAPEATPEPLTLAKAMEAALARNPAVARAQAELHAAEAQKKGILSSILPHITLTGDYERNSAEISFSSQTSTVLLLPRNDWQGKLTLSQPLFAGLRDQRAYRQSRIAVDQARDGSRGAEDDALLKVAQDYLTVVEGDALVEIEKMNLALAGKRKKQAEDLFEAGESTRADALRALADEKAAERRATTAKRDRDVAAGQLRIDLAMEGELQVADPGPLGFPIPTEADLLAQALESRPEITRAQGDVTVAELEIQKQKGAYLPVLTVDAAYLRQRTDFPTNSYGYAKLNVTIPIFDSGETASHVATAEAKLKEARVALEDQKRRVREDVHRALLDLDTARTSLALSDEQLKAGQADYDQVFEQYRSQEATALDVQTAEAALADAKRAVVQSRLDATLGELRVWYETGTLKAAVFKEVHP
jgi:outer membrane protein